MSSSSFARGALVGLGLGLLIAAGVSARADDHGVRIVIDRALVSDTLDSVLGEIDQIDHIADRGDKRLASKIHQRVSLARDEVKALAREVDQAPLAGDDARRPPRGMPPVMSDDKLKEFLGRLDNAIGSDDKMGLIRAAAASFFFTCDQVGVLVDALAFSQNKVDAAALLFPRVVDPENFDRVFDHIPSSSSREELHKRIGR